MVANQVYQVGWSCRYDLVVHPRNRKCEFSRVSRAILQFSGWTWVNSATNKLGWTDLDGLWPHTRWCLAFLGPDGRCKQCKHHSSKSLKVKRTCQEINKPQGPCYPDADRKTSGIRILTRKQASTLLMSTWYTNIHDITYNYTVIHIHIYIYNIYTISHRSINISFSGWISTKSHTTAGFLGGSPHGSKLVGNPGDESSPIPGWSSYPLSKRNPVVFWKHPELLQYMEYTYIDL